MNRHSRSSAHGVLWPAVAALLILAFAIHRPRLEIRVQRGERPRGA